MVVKAEPLQIPEADTEPEHAQRVLRTAHRAEERQYLRSQVCWFHNVKLGFYNTRIQNFVSRLTQKIMAAPSSKDGTNLVGTWTLVCIGHSKKAKYRTDQRNRTGSCQMILTESSPWYED